jgi:hypothetical protein
MLPFFSKKRNCERLLSLASSVCLMINNCACCCHRHIKQMRKILILKESLGLYLILVADRNPRFLLPNLSAHKTMCSVLCCQFCFFKDVLSLACSICLLINDCVCCYHRHAEHAFEILFLFLKESLGWYLILVGKGNTNA